MKMALSSTRVKTVAILLALMVVFQVRSSSSSSFFGGWKVWVMLGGLAVAYYVITERLAKQRREALSRQALKLG